MSLVPSLTDKKLIFLIQPRFQSLSFVAVNVSTTKYTPVVSWHSRKLSGPDSDN